MQKYNVAVLGCGAIFGRHLSAIQNNPEYYKLVGLYDPKIELQDKYSKDLNVRAYESEDAVYKDPSINCVVILTPNNLHYSQAIKALNSKKHVILEKPATFLGNELKELEQIAKLNGVNIFGVLQVRLNPAVIITKRAIANGLLGNIRGVSLVQRWQRPINYFTGWRGSMATGGGTLREFGVHYLDTLQFLLGVPKVISASFFNTKFMATDVNDTVYSLFDFGSHGGSMEISIAAEPKNLECTLSIMSDNGFVKLGGKSLDEIVVSDFLSEDNATKFNKIKQNVLESEVATLATVGASPYHPELYRQIILEPSRFALGEMYNVIDLVERIYALRK
jgi:UDP-N-acetyl-2-amino-2-deoxyglucuronate dehydrogenase